MSITHSGEPTCECGYVGVHLDTAKCTRYLASRLAALESVVNQMGPALSVPPVGRASFVPCGDVHETGAICAMRTNHTQWHSGETDNGSRVSWWSKEPAPAAPAVEPAPGENPGRVCEPWCGENQSNDDCPHTPCWGVWSTCYCSPACCDAGKPVNPAPAISKMETVAKVEAPRWHALQKDQYDRIWAALAWPGEEFEAASSVLIAALNPAPEPVSGADGPISKTEIPADAPARDGETVSHAEALDNLENMGRYTDGGPIPACDEFRDVLRRYVREREASDRHTQAVAAAALHNQREAESLRAELATAQQELAKQSGYIARANSELATARATVTHLHAELERRENEARAQPAQSPAPAGGNRELACAVFRCQTTASLMGGHCLACDEMTVALDAAEQRGAAKALDHEAIKAWRAVPNNDSQALAMMSWLALMDFNTAGGKQTSPCGIAARALAALSGDGEAGK